MNDSREQAARIAAETERQPFVLIVHTDSAGTNVSPLLSFYTSREEAEAAAPAGCVYTVVDSRVRAGHRRHLGANDLDEFILDSRREDSD